jgi:hypothetical protein
VPLPRIGTGLAGLIWFGLPVLASAGALRRKPERGKRKAESGKRKAESGEQ